MPVQGCLAGILCVCSLLSTCRFNPRCDCPWGDCGVGSGLRCSKDVHFYSFEYMCMIFLLVLQHASARKLRAAMPCPARARTRKRPLHRPCPVRPRTRKQPRTTMPCPPRARTRTPLPCCSVRARFRRVPHAVLSTRPHPQTTSPLPRMSILQGSFPETQDLNST